MQLVDGMVRRTNEQLSESTGLLQDILKAAADQEVRAGGGRLLGAACWVLGTARLDWQAVAQQTWRMWPRPVQPTWTTLAVDRAERRAGAASPAPTPPTPNRPHCRRAASGRCRWRPRSWRRCGA